jgi:predicted translin family RNA/ssDNA-binding protein
MLTAKQEPTMVNDGLVNLLSWCKREREYLEMQREMLRSGTFRIFRQDGSAQVDESAQSIVRITSNIAELDRILADYAARSPNG